MSWWICAYLKIKDSIHNKGEKNEYEGNQQPLLDPKKSKSEACYFVAKTLIKRIIFFFEIAVEMKSKPQSEMDLPQPELSVLLSKYLGESFNFFHLH